MGRAGDKANECRRTRLPLCAFGPDVEVAGELVVIFATKNDISSSSFSETGRTTLSPRPRRSYMNTVKRSASSGTSFGMGPKGAARLQRRDVDDVMMKAFQALRTLVAVCHQQHGDAEGMPDFEVVIRIADE